MVGNEGFSHSSGHDTPLLIMDICLYWAISSIIRILIPLCILIKKLTLRIQGEFWCLFGWEWGIRTPDAGFRVRSLTTWRIPSKKDYVSGIVSKGYFFANLFFFDFFCIFLCELHSIFLKKISLYNCGIFGESSNIWFKILFI